MSKRVVLKLKYNKSEKARKMPDYTFLFDPDLVTTYAISRLLIASGVSERKADRFVEDTGDVIQAMRALALSHMTGGYFDQVAVDNLKKAWKKQIRHIGMSESDADAAAECLEDLLNAVLEVI